MQYILSGTFKYLRPSLDLPQKQKVGYFVIHVEGKMKYDVQVRQVEAHKMATAGAAAVYGNPTHDPLEQP